MNDKIIITVDGRKIETESKKMLLDIFQENGIYVPTLCNHPSLVPSGSCRLCIVEISKEEWKGQSRLVTSCLYPAEDGLIISTRSREVLENRRTLLELYLAQCPTSTVIRDLARREGIDQSSFKVSDTDDKCIMCGLCTRVCQDCGPGAIATLMRGIDKKVGSDPEGLAEACTGCRTCAYICPTGAIPLKQENQVLTIWNRQFEIPVCTVKDELCLGCGICEEVCPFAIPRVSLQKEGLTTAYISPETCVGCGICVGACPTAAIVQKQSKQLSDISELIEKRDLKGKNIVFACSRSPLPDSNDELIRVSCIGRIDLSTMLYCLAAGASGVGIMCRDRMTCPYSQGGDRGEHRTKLAKEIAAYCGLNSERIALLSPYPGQEGPEYAWLKFKKQIDKLLPELTVHLSHGKFTERGLDLALKIIEWIKHQQKNNLTLPKEFVTALASSSNNQVAAEKFSTLPELNFLFRSLMEEPVVLRLFEQAIATDSLGKLLQIVKNETPFTFTLKPEKRYQLLKKHQNSPTGLVCSDLGEYLQYLLLLRPGAWLQSKNPLPLLKDITDHNLSESAEVHCDLQFRIVNHPILPALSAAEIDFSFNGTNLKARKGEAITSAVYAAGIHIFGHHERDGGAQGIYCVNGQCSQCMVIADGKPVKGCMTAVQEGMVVESVEGLPGLTDLPPEEAVIPETKVVETDVLIIGGGPAGISAAIELGNVGVDVLIIDDKHELGGKLSLQTHNFFGSVKDCYAGERGIKIGTILTDMLKQLPTINIWHDSTVVGVFSDGLFGVSGFGTYKLVKAQSVLFSTGAREKSLALPGADLPGVYGAGAFQTLVNRDLIRCAERLFIVGGGNVGLIGAYHALQAGIDVVGLVEALPRCGGYKVHEDKIKRLGVPVWTSHTVLRIEGKEEVERVVVAAVDENFKPLPGSERAFNVDTVLIAVGLSPVNELFLKAIEYGIKTYTAGDAEEIAEASAAIFSGKIVGRKIANDMGIDLPVPSNWEEFGLMLKHKPGESKPFRGEDRDDRVFPLIRCMQEIPCNPCTEACPNNCIKMEDSILALPEYTDQCIGCGRCVLACPGLAINLVINDYDPEQKKALLMMPYEFVNEIIPVRQEVTTTDMEGNVVGNGKVISYRDRPEQNSRRLLLLEVPEEDKLKVAGFRIRDIDEGTYLDDSKNEADPIVCRCERVRKSEIVAAIRNGVRDMNQLKAVARTGLGGCNGKTCTDLILRIFREEGVAIDEITLPTHRPLVAEVHLGDFIAATSEGRKIAD
jgi:sarcosine oxidase, subunit alpha